MNAAFVAAIVAGAVALWAGPWTRAARPPDPHAVAARPAAPKPAPAPASTTLASIPPVKPAEAPQASAAPLPPVREADAAPMSAAQEAALDAWLISAYRRCWKSTSAAPEGERYFPKIRVAFKTNGALGAPPRLVNPPSDPAWRPEADAALRAVKACDPLHVPEKYAPYYPQWKTKTVYFDAVRP